MTEQLTVAGVAVTAVVLPTSPAPKTVEFSFSDTVGENRSPYTGATQTYEWPGADECMVTVTMPLLKQNDADVWISALMECRGIKMPFRLGDPLKKVPAGNLQGGIPVIDGGANAAMLQTVSLRGFAANTFRALLPGDYLQIGQRLHRNMGVVSPDANGKATLSIWPSLREAPADGDAVIFNNPTGLFRRADNTQAWSVTVGRLTSISFKCREYR